MAYVAPYTLCLVLLLFSLPNPFFTNAQTYKNVSLGSSLTARKNNNDLWVSESGEFAFGFREIEDSRFLLAIWFNKISPITIVWSANGRNLVESGSKVELTADGQLVLKNTTGQTIWQPSSVSVEISASYAAMLDTGNFVLASSDSTRLWGSFDEPTDTILPTQTMVPGRTLFARYNETNYSKGRFLFVLQENGNLVLSTKMSYTDAAAAHYWQSNTATIGTKLIFNKFGSIYLTVTDGSNQTIPPNNDEGNIPSTGDFYHRAILEYDGVFRRYVYPKSTTSSGKLWTALPGVIPNNICVDLIDNRGSGACGINSYCVYDQGKERPSCLCPVGYTLIDPDDLQRGCKRPFVPQSCDDQGLSEKQVFDFHEIENSDWVGSDYKSLGAVTEQVCREACLVDCYCAAVVFGTSECYKKRYPLLNGRADPTVSLTTLLKIRKGNSTFKPESGDSKKKDGDCRKKDHFLRVALLVLIAASVLLCTSLLLFFLSCFYVYRFNRRKINKVDHQPAGVNLQCFSYEELERVTNGFKEKLGRGSAGTVFKGVFSQSSNEEEEHFVAVKRLENMVTEDESEFKAEVSSIGRTNHRNIVRLLGFCNEGQHRLLVYEYMKNGSLANFLFGDSKLNWKQRREIALGTARGLLYLHEECSSLIIHCDIKPQNILLDDSFTARIADFGLAKLLKIDRTQTTTAIIRGTKGYVALEWFRNKPITAKVDVYSYGVLLLELICSRKNFDAEAEDQNQMVLSDWVYDCFVDRKVHLLVKNDEEALDDIEMVEKYVMTAIWCIQEDPSLRPSMKRVIQMLEGTLHVSIPPDPSP